MSQAAIAAMCGLIPTMFMALVRSLAKIDSAISAATFGSALVRKCVAPCRPSTTERMLDRLSTLAHGLWICIKALLHCFEQVLMLPPWNPPLLEAIQQALASWAAMSVLLCQRDKVLLTEEPVGLGARRQRLDKVTVTPASWQAGIPRLLK